MDNHGAEEREGVKSTYAGAEGFRTFRIRWDRFIADAVLRCGSKDSNDEDTATKGIQHLTGKIRRALGEEGPIIVRMDADFCDKKIYQACEDLRIGYVSSGRLLEEIKSGAEHRPSSDWVLLILTKAYHKKAFSCIDVSGASPGPPWEMSLE